MPALRLPSIFRLLAVAVLVVVTTACYTVENDLEDLTIYNLLDPESGIELVEVDSIAATKTEVEFWFRVNLHLIPSHVTVEQVVIYRNGSLSKVLSKGNFSYFIDINVTSHNEYVYQFALRDSDMRHSKLSVPYTVRTD